ncbi:F0F1 ATP synthase subunit epsilon [Seohaeicola nanhaiensis]|uniref:ATP synthase epsilon chain n=1 Tax=Seohaeicola nanhaiensis TaxID=1387282 RepID=A0ABV9KDB4_9RHOB
MRLRIVTPLEVVVDQTIDALRAEDATGSFGILPGHAPFVTALSVSIVSWRAAEREHFCAIRGGVLSVEGRTVAATSIAIATREAVTGDHLATLDADVLARFRSDADAERTEHVEAMRLQFNAIRHLVSRLSADRMERRW